MERRGSIRYPLRLPVRIVAVGGEVVSIPAQTSNISCTGVLLRCGADFAEGQPVEYVIGLYSDYNLRLRGKGKIERTTKASQPSPDNSGPFTVALTLDTFEFIREAGG